MLSYLLGTTVTASTIVLTAYMAGFGIGANFWGKYVNSRNNPKKVLSYLIFGIGILSLINFLLFTKILPGIYSMLASKDSSLFADIIVYSLSIIFLLATTFLMGGVLPIVYKMVITNSKNISGFLGKVYAFETIGCAVGGLGTGFLFLGNFGQIGTIILVFSVSIITGLYVLKNKSVLPDESLNENISNTKKQSKKATLTENDILANKKLALISTFITGFAIIGLQITWIRSFKIYLTNTSYSFALIASMVIIGLFVGSMIFKKYGERIKDQKSSMIKAMILMSVFSLLGLLFIVRMPQIIMIPLGDSLANPFVRIIMAPVLASLLIVFPPAVVSGFALPLACRIYTVSNENISKNVGRVLLINTYGSVLGPLATTFIFIPLIGVGKSILVISLILFAGVLIITFSVKGILKTKLYRNISLLALIVIFISLVIAERVRIVPPSMTMLDKSKLFYRETTEGTITGNPTDVNNPLYVNNSVVIGSTYDAIKVVKMIGHFPFYSGLKCNKVLVIGFGIGVSTSAIAEHKEVKEIDVVELVTGVTEAAHYYEELNKGIIRDPRLNIIAGDGRHYLQSTSKKYDMITCDPTHPVLGSGNLYTHEYFELCKDHLTDKGMVSQYLPLHKLRYEDLMGIIKTFHSVFPNSSVWLGHQYAILLGGKAIMKIDFNTWDENIRKIPKDIYFYAEAYHFAACLVMDSTAIATLPENIKINTDNKSYTEFFDLDCLQEDNTFINLKKLNDNRSDVDNVFENIPDKTLMSQYIDGNKALTMSVYNHLQGNSTQALQYLRQAVKVNPTDQEYPFLIKFVYKVEK